MAWRDKREGVLIRLKGLVFWLAFEVIFMMIMQTVKQDNEYRVFILFFTMVLLLMFAISRFLIFIFDRKPERHFREFLPESSPTMILILVVAILFGCLITAVSLLFETLLATFVGAFLFSILLIGYVLLPTWHGFF